MTCFGLHCSTKTLSAMKTKRVVIWTVRLGLAVLLCWVAWLTLNAIFFHVWAGSFTPSIETERHRDEASLYEAIFLASATSALYLVCPHWPQAPVKLFRFLMRQEPQTRNR